MLSAECSCERERHRRDESRRPLPFQCAPYGAREARAFLLAPLGWFVVAKSGYKPFTAKFAKVAQRTRRTPWRRTFPRRPATVSQRSGRSETGTYYRRWGKPKGERLWSATFLDFQGAIRPASRTFRVGRKVGFSNHPSRSQRSSHHQADR